MPLKYYAYKRIQKYAKTQRAKPLFSASLKFHNTRKYTKVIKNSRVVNYLRSSQRLEGNLVKLLELSLR